MHASQLLLHLHATYHKPLTGSTFEDERIKSYLGSDHQIHNVPSIHHPSIYKQAAQVLNRVFRSQRVKSKNAESTQLLKHMKIPSIHSEPSTGYQPFCPIFQNSFISDTRTHKRKTKRFLGYPIFGIKSLRSINDKRKTLFHPTSTTQNSRPIQL